MKPALCFLLLVLCGCEPPDDDWIEKQEKTLCDLRDGERGCGVHWAFTGNYSVYPRCMPPGTIDTPTWRVGNVIHIGNRTMTREQLGCPADVDFSSLRDELVYCAKRCGPLGCGGSPADEARTEMCLKDCLRVKVEEITVTGDVLP